MMYFNEEDKKLLPCPFCGAKAKVFPHSHIDNRTNDLGQWCVICQNEDAECNVRLLYEDTKESAIIRWNRRLLADKEKPCTCGTGYDPECPSGHGAEKEKV